MIASRMVICIRDFHGLNPSLLMSKIYENHRDVHSCSELSKRFRNVKFSVNHSTSWSLDQEIVRAKTLFSIRYYSSPSYKVCR